MGKTIIRIVRTQKNQQVINIPGDVSRHLGLEGGDAVIFELLDGDHVALTRVDPEKLKVYIGRKVE